MLEEIITNFNKFDPEQMDHDEISLNKIYFNIYNNKLNKPLQKFNFLVNNVKLKKIYEKKYEDTLITLAFNNKNSCTNKLINFLKDLFKLIKIKFDKIFSNLILYEPWTEFENYPFLINLFLSKSFLFIDSSKKILDISEFNYDKSYSILFEISYLKILKNDDKYALKIKLSVLMIQIEPEIDYKNTSLISLTNETSSINNDICKNTKNYSEKDTMFRDSILKNSNIQHVNFQKNNDKSFTSQRVSLNELIEKKNNLKSINFIKEEIINNDEKLNDIFVNKKNELKKVKKKEKSLFKKIKNKSNKNKKKNLIDLEKELNLLII